MSTTTKDLETDQLGHIDSPENSDNTTETLQDESLIDDLSSVLREGMFGGAIHDDITITEDDDTTVCETEVPTKPSTNRHHGQMQRIDSEDNGENPLQFGFENIVFEIDNRCDDQKSSKEPIKYCSLAKFVEGNDIARKSFKVSLRYLSTSSNNLLS